MKKKHLLFLFILLVIVVPITFAFLYAAFKPLNSSITIDGLRVAAEETDYILVKSDDSYFEIQGSTEFSTLFEFDEWKQRKEKAAGEAVLVLRFAEAWIVEFFADGTVTAHDGYAASGTKQDAYYTIPSHVTDALTVYITTHGVQHELGDGAIGIGTFHK